jgi:zinc transporter 9
MAHGSRRAVGAAIIGNTVVTLSKAGAFLVTGSAAMLSESMHSLADTLNQVLLMVGIQRSTRRADPRFPFGYGAERAVWALLSGVGIFFLGCGVTVYHGVHNFLHPRPLENLGIALTVLLVSLVIEGAVLIVALRTVARSSGGAPFFSYLRHEADPTTTAVVMEDSAACLGVLLALAGIGLTRWTGNQIWDAAASIVIGFLLGAIALWLIARSRFLLVGPAVPRRDRERIRAILAGNPVVEKIVSLRTRVMDTETYRVSAEIEFAGEALSAELESNLREAYGRIASYEEFQGFAAEFADLVVERLGDEIDAIEDAIRNEVPKARYLDIEAD